MTPLQVVTLAFLAVVFVLWAFIWFRALFTLKSIADRRRDAAGVGYFGSIGITLGVFTEFFTRPEHRKRRWQVLGMTVFLFVVIFAMKFALTPTG